LPAFQRPGSEGFGNVKDLTHRSMLFFVTDAENV
jgi:hypothetical protein